MAEFEGRTLHLRMKIAWPWPPEQGVNFTLINTDDLSYDVTFDHEGKLRAKLIDVAGSNIREVESVRVIFQSEGYAFVLVRWNLDKTADFFINFEMLPQDVEQTVYFLGLKPKECVIDYVGIQSAERKRKDLRRSLKGNGSFREPLRQRLDDLKRQLHELDGLLALQIAGHHMESSLASKLRILVGAGKGNGLVQKVAALADLPLPIYATGDQSTATRWPAAFVITDWSMSKDPDFASAETDLDAWLDWEAIRLGSEVLTHRELIETIADQRGAHFDPDPDKAIVRLLNSEDRGRTTLLNYIGTGAAALFELGNRLVAEATARLEK